MNHPTEFLILKFDKCKNWPQIAEQCVRELDDKLYKGSGNLNKKKLWELKDTAIVVFEQAGWLAVPNYQDAGGILRFKNLHAGGQYEEDFNGLQYYGKGGTDLLTREDKSIDENYNKQLNLMRLGARLNPDVMGMMYWTTTGLVGNIKQRNEMMWKTPRKQELEFLWLCGMGHLVKKRVPKIVHTNRKLSSTGELIKRFLPNFVMVDFADTDKCDTIFNLNSLVPTELSKTLDQIWDDG